METIDVVEIKSELTRRAKRLYGPSNAKGFDIIRELAKRAKNAEQFGNELTGIINQILDEKGIELKDPIEREAFLKEIRPVYLELIKDYIKTK